MADGYGFPQQSAGNYYYQQHTQSNNHSRRSGRNETPPINIRPEFNTETPPPSRSPDFQPASQNPYGMYPQGHQQGQHGRMQMMYNYQQQNSRIQPQQNHHHQNLLQENSGNSNNGTILGQESNYSSGVLSNSTPNFTPNNLQNSTTTRGLSQQMNEHWVEQLKLYNESQRAKSAMTEQHAPHYFARMKASENRILDNISPDGEVDERRRPSNLDGGVKRQDWQSMDMSGLGLRVLAAPLFSSYAFLNELYLACNKISQLPAAIGQLRQLRHLDISSNHLTDLPPELGMCVYLKNLLVFDNNLRTLPGELGSLYQLEMLGIEGNPLDAATKQEIVERGTKSLIHHLREEAPVPLPPPARSMIYLEDEPPLDSQDHFKVFSYNILCDTYVNVPQYPYTPLVALAWEYRKELILQEIQAQDPDFVCLQEVNTNSFEEFFSMKLAYANYKGVFWPKTRSKTMSEKDAKIADGCATYYKASKYILLDKQLVDYANIAIHRPDMKNQHDIYNRVMPRDDIAVVTFFENRSTGARIVVVNTHIFWNPAYADVKLIQIAILMEYLDKLIKTKYVSWPASKDKKRYTMSEENAEPEDIPAESMEYTSSAQLPLVLCTDLNSTPDSSVYELLSSGRVARDHPELVDYQYGHFTRDGIKHPFSLRSAYSLLDDTPDALSFTNYTPGFIGMIDHIWYSTNSLEVTALLGPVDTEYMKRVPGFPNYHFPSDHLSLLVELHTKGRKEKKNLPEPDFGPQRDERWN